MNNLNNIIDEKITEDGREYSEEMDDFERADPINLKMADIEP